MAIEQQIKQIVEKRKKRVPGIRASLDHLEQVAGGINGLEGMRKQMLLPDGSPNMNGIYGPVLRANPMLAEQMKQLDFHACRQAIANAKALLNECLHRNSRPTVQISVVGQARIGKSTILQTLSGLNDNVIPAFESSDCTGATSIIHNVEGVPLRATISFKSEEEMLKLAKAYLEKILPEDKNEFSLYSMSDIQHLDMKAIKKKIVQHPEKTDPTYYGKLQGMVLHYSEWASLAGRRDPIVLTDEEEIVTYVAQNNGYSIESSKRKEYYKYLAVDKCVIECSFPRKGLGPITLIDSIGMGDRALGIDDAMLYTVSEESDAVIHLMRPEKGTGNGVSAAVNSDYNKIKERCGSRALDKWLFHLLNEISTPTATLACNSEFCRMAKKTISPGGDLPWMGHAPVIIDVYKDRKGVTDFFIDLLQSLAQDLDEVDKIFEDRAREALKGAQLAYHAVCSALSDMIGQSYSSSPDATALSVELTDQCWTAIRFHMEEFMQKWEKMQDEPHFGVHEHCRSIIYDMTQGHFVPAADELEKMIIGPNVMTVMEEQMNQIRNLISTSFAEVDMELQANTTEMKNDVAMLLCDTIGLGKLCEMNPHAEPKEWLHDFAELCLREQSKYRNLYDWFTRLYNFEFSAKGFMTYEIRRVLKPLDPRVGQIPAVNNPNKKRTAMSMCASLRQMVNNVSRAIESTLKELCIKPNRAIWAEVDEFVDHICYAKDAEQTWKILLQGNAMRLWSDQIVNVVSLGKIEKTVHDTVKALIRMDQVSYFSI